MLATPGRAADDFANGRRIFLEKADCAYCHGWAATARDKANRRAEPPTCGAVNWGEINSLW
jgi:hypothetical protein